MSKLASIDKILLSVLVDPTTGCWNWKGALNGNGYGRFGKDGNSERFAHRYSYSVLRGKIPDGMVIDHICRNRKCCNPFHLRAVTNKENIMYGDTVTARNSLKTQCKRGHEFNEENTYHANGERHCRACKKSRNLFNTREHRKKPKYRNLPIEEKISSKIEMKDGCAVWRGAVDASGYPKMQHNNKMIYPSQLIYKSIYGELPDNMMVYKRCGNKLCCLGEHLFALPKGTSFQLLKKEA